MVGDILLLTFLGMAAESGGGLSLSISGRDSIYVMETLSVEVSFENSGEKPIRTVLAFLPRERLLTITYRRPGSDLALDFAYPKPMWSVRSHLGRVRLDPGERAMRELLVGYDADRRSFVFGEPGVYYIHASYRDVYGGGGTIESNTLTVRVEPPPEEEERAFESYSAEAALFSQLLSPALATESIIQGIDEAGRFCRAHPTSSLARNVWRGLSAVLRTRADNGLASPAELELERELDGLDASPEPRAVFASTLEEYELRFEPRSAVILPRHTEVLDEVSGLYHGGRIRVEGHADRGDDAGSVQQCLELSRARAEAVRAALTARGVSRDRMAAVWLSCEAPGCRDATPECRESNRRVRIEFEVQ